MFLITVTAFALYKAMEEGVEHVWTPFSNILELFLNMAKILL